MKPSEAAVSFDSQRRPACDCEARNRIDDALRMAVLIGVERPGVAHQLSVEEDGAAQIVEKNPKGL